MKPYNEKFVQKVETAIIQYVNEIKKPNPTAVPKKKLEKHLQTTKKHYATIARANVIKLAFPADINSFNLSKENWRKRRYEDLLLIYDPTEKKWKAFLVKQKDVQASNNTKT